MCLHIDTKKDPVIVLTQRPQKHHQKRNYREIRTFWSQDHFLWLTGENELY